MSPHHIPFPRAFLSLNTPSKQVPESAISTSPETASHGFLSNRPVAKHPRQESVSSVTSEDSVASSASSPPAATPSASPVLERAVPAFLALNTKHVAPTPAAAPTKDTSVNSAGFLSNRH